MFNGSHGSKIILINLPVSPIRSSPSLPSHIHLSSKLCRRRTHHRSVVIAAAAHAPAGIATCALHDGGELPHLLPPTLADLAIGVPCLCPQ